MKKYTERLKGLREDRDITQETLAQILNCTKTAYGNWENGKRDIKVEVLIKLAKYYNVSLDYIAGLTNDPTPKWTTSKKNITNSFNNNSGSFGDITIK